VTVVGIKPTSVHTSCLTIDEISLATKATFGHPSLSEDRWLYLQHVSAKWVGNSISHQDLEDKCEQFLCMITKSEIGRQFRNFVG